MLSAPGSSRDAPRTLRNVTHIGDILQRGADGGRISAEEALLLYTDAPLHALGEAADAVRRRRYPDGIVTYLIDRNINYTNVCVTACKFCAFYRAPKHAEGWSHPIEEILRRCGEAVDLGATQVMLQGGHHPEYGVEYYEDAVPLGQGGLPGAGHPLDRAERDPAHGQGLRRLHRGGGRAGSRRPASTRSPAPARRCCPTRPRTAIAPLKESGERWLEVMEVAHGLGVESTATMMMGTGETNAERIEHLRMIRDVQDRTGGFRAFIPWTYQPENNHLKGRTQATVAGVPAADRGGPALLRQRRPPAVVLADHRQGRRPALAAHGRRRPRARSCWRRTSSPRPAPGTGRTCSTWSALIRSAGRIPAQRDTLYRHLKVHWTPADDPTDERVALALLVDRADRSACPHGQPAPA